MFRLQLPDPAEVEVQRKKKVTEVKQNSILFAAAVVGLRLGRMVLTHARIEYHCYNSIDFVSAAFLYAGV